MKEEDKFINPKKVIEKKKTPLIKEDIKVGEPAVSYGDKYTYADYMKFEYDYMVELIRGKIFKMSPGPKLNHQEIVGNFYGFIWQYLKGKPCRVFIAPFDVVLPVQNRKKKEASNTVVQPDVCVICDSSKLDEAGFFGAPDWIIEVLSPHTSKKDLQLKYDVYEEVGVKEYWIVMPKEKLVEVFVLQNNKYKRVNTYTPEDVIHSNTLPDLPINLAEVFDNDLLL